MTGTELLGLAMLYAIGHFFFIQKKSYESRSSYEKVVTWVGIGSIVLIIIGIATQ